MKRSTCLLVVLSAVAAVTAPSGTTAARPAQSPLDGRWRQTAAVTARELIARGMPPKMVATAPKLEKPALDFNAGRFRVFDLASGRTIGAGRYAVSERSVRVVFTSAPTIKSLVGRVSWLSWSVYRDRLTFSALPGRDGSALLPWKVHPWTRVQ